MTKLMRCLSIVAIGVVIAACSRGTSDSNTSQLGAISNTSTSAQSTSTASPTTALDDLPGTFAAPTVDMGTPRLAHLEPNTAAEVTATVGWGVTVTVQFPAGAVNSAITVGVRPASVGGFMALEFTPEGLFLQQPARIQFVGANGDFFVRDGWLPDGTPRFAPTWRSATTNIALLRLRPVVLTHAFPPEPKPDTSTPTMPTLPPIGIQAATTTTTTIAIATPSGTAPVPDWSTGLSVALSDPTTAQSNGADRSAWAGERGSEQGQEQSQEQTDGTAAANQARGRYLERKCADRDPPKMDREEFFNLINGDAVRITDPKQVEGCLTLAWQVSESVQAQIPVNGEVINFNEYQLASSTAIIDGGTSVSSAPIFGHSDGPEGVASLILSALAKGAGALVGIDTPPISTKYCAPAPDRQSGEIQVQTDPLPDNNLRLKITVKPGEFPVCNSAFMMPPFGWAMVSALRGEAEGTPIVLTMPIAPQISRNTGFLQQVEGVKVKTAEGGAAQITVEGRVISVSFQVVLSLTPRL